MARAFLSQSWHRVGGLRPRLRSHAETHRQQFRGQTWFVLQDHQTGKFFRLSPAANLMIALMDGRRTMQELWDHACTRFPDTPPTQDEAIRLLAQLHSADLLQTDHAPDLGELARRAEKTETRTLLSYIRNPLALRFPLLDPDAFLTATLPLVGWAFTRAGLLLWLAVVVAGAVVAAMNIEALAADLYGQALTAQNVMLALLVYPVVKALHELGHGYAAKASGGEVHEMGLMLLVFLPIPYVDASSAVAFPNKWRRALVGAGGIMVELLLAALATMFWVSAEPGLARAVAFNVMLIGGVSTLLFNGNPLLRFDGYYILADLVEIPNLAQRANQYVIHLIQYRLLGIDTSPNPVTARGEPVWFVGYAVASFLYRLSIWITIALIVANMLFFVGVALALWSVFTMFVWPLAKGVAFLATDARLRGRRGRAVATTALWLVLPVVAVLAAPFPMSTLAQGVVLAPEGSALRAGTHGFVVSLDHAAGDHVTAGTGLLRLEDPVLDARVTLFETQLAELTLRRDAVRSVDRAQADALTEQVEHVGGALARERERVEALVVRAPRDGTFVAPGLDDLPGRFVRQGDELGYVLDAAAAPLRVVVPQDSVDLVRRRTESVSVRYASAPEAPHPARILRVVPSASADLPAPALAALAGGALALDPGDPDQARLLERAFQLDIEALDPSTEQRVGERVWVRFQHGVEPLALRLVRATRQLFLSELDV